MNNKNAWDLIDKMQIGITNFENDDEYYNDLINGYAVVKKDVSDGQELKVLGLENVKGFDFSLLCDNLITINCNLKKERKFFETIGVNTTNLDNVYEWLCNDGKDYFKNNDICLITNIDINKNINGSLYKSLINNKRNEFFREIKESKNYYYAKIIDKNNGGFIVDVDGVIAFLPGSLASANKIINFNTFIGKKIPVMIEDYIREGDRFIVSNKKYIQYIIPKKLEELDYTKLYTGEITGTSTFGIFIEFDEIFTGLLHFTEMTEDTKKLFEDRKNNFKPGDKVNFYIKEIDKNNRIILTETFKVIKTIEDFKASCEGTFQDCEIVHYKPIGSFVKIKFEDNDFIGLLNSKEYPKNFVPEKNKKLKLWVQFVDIINNKIYLNWDKED